jgi:putative ABC transport system permease protein
MEPWNGYNYLSVRLAKGDKREALNQVEAAWNQIFPNQLFDYQFLDNSLNKHYSKEYRTKDMFTFFAIMALVIASLGLFGLVSFFSEQRLKEIGIRKTLGANLSSILILLSKGFLYKIIIAIAIGCPIAYYLVNIWLQNFSYRIDISLGSFVIAGVIILTITLITVFFNVIKSAVLNPVRFLRND